MISKHSTTRFLTACRCFEKLVYLPFLKQVFHPWWCETPRVIQQQFWMKECDIFRGQNILWPLLHIFRRFKTPTPRICAPVLHGGSNDVSGVVCWQSRSVRWTNCESWWVCEARNAFERYSSNTAARNSFVNDSTPTPITVCITALTAIRPSVWLAAW